MLSSSMTDFIDFKTLERPKSPNTYLLAPDGYCQQAEADQISPSFAATPAALFSACADIVENQKSWALAASDADAGRLQFISTSALMRYKDDIDIHVLPAGTDAAQLAIYSRSRVGYSDLGANAKRVSALLDALKQKGFSG